MSDNLDPKELLRQKKQNEALLMRMRGISFDAIGYKLGISRTTAFTYVKDALDTYNQDTQEDIKDSIALHLATKDELLSRLFTDLDNCSDIEDPETGRLLRDGIRTKQPIYANIIKTLAEIAKIKGLYSPEKFETTSTIKDDQIVIDYSSLDADELSVLFADRMRDELN